MNSIKMDLAAPSVDGVVNGELDPSSVPEAVSYTHLRAHET